MKTKFYLGLTIFAIILNENNCFGMEGAGGGSNEILRPPGLGRPAAVGGWESVDEWLKQSQQPTASVNAAPNLVAPNGNNSQNIDPDFMNRDLIDIKLLVEQLPTKRCVINGEDSERSYEFLLNNKKKEFGEKVVNLKDFLKEAVKKYLEAAAYESLSPRYAKTAQYFLYAAEAYKKLIGLEQKTKELYGEAYKEPQEDYDKLWRNTLNLAGKKLILAAIRDQNLALESSFKPDFSSPFREHRFRSAARCWEKLHDIFVELGQPENECLENSAENYLLTVLWAQARANREEKKQAENAALSDVNPTYENVKDLADHFCDAAIFFKELARVYKKFGKEKMPESFFERSLKKVAENYKKAARIYKNNGYSLSAINSRDFDGPLVNLAKVYQEFGEKTKEKEIWEEVAEIFKKIAETEEAKNEGSVIWDYFNPSSSNYFLSAAEFYLKSGDLVKAKEMADKAALIGLIKNPDDYALRKHFQKLVKIYRAMGLEKEAQKYEKLLNLIPKPNSFLSGIIDSE